MKWTTAHDVRAQVSRWWDRGELLSSFATGETIFPRRVKLREPTSGEMTNQFEDVRSWIDSLERLRHCRLEMRDFKHRVFGRNSIPSAAWIDTIDDALALIGKRQEARKFISILEATKREQPQLVDWIARRPLRVLELHDEWVLLLSVVAWLQDHPRPGIYLRQVDIAGVDSKFIETHRGVLSELLDLALPDTAFDHSLSGVGHFSRRYGFNERPVRIRFRILDPGSKLFNTSGDQDISVDADSFSQLNPSVARVFITENEVNYLCFGQLKDSMVIFGSGYGFDELSKAEWLKNRHLIYWGDIDTHGFAILSSARSCFPQIQSVLMDEQTLLRFPELWGTEPCQHKAESLPLLTFEEEAVYRGLRQNKWRENLRLEQERIVWNHAWSAIQNVHAEKPTTALDKCLLP